jgi:hypothetical protein
MASTYRISFAIVGTRQVLTEYAFLAATPSHRAKALLPSYHCAVLPSHRTALEHRSPTCWGPRDGDLGTGWIPQALI